MLLVGFVSRRSRVGGIEDIVINDKISHKNDKVSHKNDKVSHK